MKIKLSELKKIIREQTRLVEETHRSEFPDSDAAVRYDDDVVVDYPDDPGPGTAEVTLTPDELAGLAYEVDISEDEVNDRFELQLITEPHEGEHPIGDDGYEVQGQDVVELWAIDSVTGRYYLADDDGYWTQVPSR